MTCGHYTLCFKPVVFILYKQSHVWKPNVLNTLKKKMFRRCGSPRVPPGLAICSGSPGDVMV